MNTALAKAFGHPVAQGNVQTGMGEGRLEFYNQFGHLNHRYFFKGLVLGILWLFKLDTTPNTPVPCPHAMLSPSPF